MFEQLRHENEAAIAETQTRMNDLDILMSQSKQERSDAYHRIETLRNSLAHHAFMALRHTEDQHDGAMYLREITPKFNEDQQAQMIERLEKLAVLKTAPDEVVAIIGGENHHNTVLIVDSDKLEIGVAHGDSLTLNKVPCTPDTFILTEPTLKTEYYSPQWSGVLIGKEQLSSFMASLGEEQEQNTEFAFRLSLATCSNPRSREVWSDVPETLKDYAVSMGIRKLEWISDHRFDEFDRASYEFEAIRLLLATHYGTTDFDSVDALNEAVNAIAKHYPDITDRYDLAATSYFGWRDAQQRRERSHEW